MRIPHWASRPGFSCNGHPVAVTPTAAGYAVVHRRWQPGDTLSFDLGLAPRLTIPGRRIDAVHGMAAIERGPLVYCFEQADQPAGADLEDLAIIPGELRGRTATVPGIGPTVLIETAAARLPPAAGPGLPYTAARPAADGGPGAGEPLIATALPYFQWDNRDRQAMRVWLPLAP